MFFCLHQGVPPCCTGGFGVGCDGEFAWGDDKEGTPGVVCMGDCPLLEASFGCGPGCGRLAGELVLLPKYLTHESPVRGTVIQMYRRPSLETPVRNIGNPQLIPTPRLERLSRKPPKFMGFLNL